MRALRVVLAAGVALLSSRCILVVSDDVPESGEHCRFSGEDGQCGRCIQQQCRPAVDACCAELACDATLAAVESCATIADAGCDALETDGSELGACVSNRCGAVCERRIAPSTTFCREPPLGEDAACECDQSNPANDFICSEAAYPETVCCAPPGWPAAGLECSCRPLGCNPSEGGCLCALVDYVPDGSVCQAPPCCVDGDVCTCRQSGCFDWETPVSACTIDVVGCPPEQ